MPTIFFDFDSTVVTQESLDEVIALALSAHPDRENLVAAVEAITNQGMNGELAFTDSVKARFAVCPLTESHFATIGQNLTHHLTPGMPELFNWLNHSGWSVFIISGGFRPSILPVATHLGLTEAQVVANDIKTDSSGAVVGVDETSWLWTNQGKAPVIHHLLAAHVSDGPTVLVGDGSNDLAAYTAGAVDYFVGFGANVVREKVQREAPHFVVSTAELQTFLKTL